MDKKEMLAETIRAERDFAERRVLDSIGVLRRILDTVEKDVKEGKPTAYNGFQGNEWRLYTELANLERLTAFTEYLKKL